MPADVRGGVADQLLIRSVVADAILNFLNI